MMDPVELRFDLTAADWTDALMTSYLARRSRLLKWIGKPWLVVPVLGLLLLNKHDWSTVVCCVLAGVLVYPQGLFALTARQLTRNNPQLCQGIQLSVDEQGLRVTTATTSTKLTSTKLMWSRYTCYVETKRGFLLMPSSRGMVQPIPKTALADQFTAERLRELLDRHLPLLGSARPPAPYQATFGRWHRDGRANPDDIPGVDQEDPGMASKYLFLNPTSDEPEDYYDVDEVIDYEHPAIEALVDRLQRPFGDPHAQYDEFDYIGYAQAAFVFVRDEIAHSADVDYYSTAYRASDVLRHRNAICFGKAHLLTALLRAREIPTGLCYQRLADDRSSDGFLLHGLVATRLVSRWSRLDPRGNKPGVNAQFELHEARLAFAVDPARGEIDYPYVYPTPPPNLLAGLRAARPGPDVYSLLPTELA